jgi:hypothetical protein
MPQVPTDVIVVAGLAVAALLLLMAVFANLYRKAGPHEALIVYGFRGTRVIKGHGTVILPMVENVRGLSLELMSFDVAPQQDLYTKQGVAVTVEAVAQIKVKSDRPIRAFGAHRRFVIARLRVVGGGSSGVNQQRIPRRVWTFTYWDYARNRSALKQEPKATVDGGLDRHGFGRDCLDCGYPSLLGSRYADG